ncbi:DEAD/DEAH box helicase [Candidatus Micrarchaeota archaeon]|nr:DEAD/DEAH box helicase [Candidatus Micrarchaeota archaeon]
MPINPVQERQEQVASLVQKLGYNSLNPMQQAAVEGGLLEDQNFVVSSPTASGKTLVALMKTLSYLQNPSREGKKVVYVVPLRALAKEKFDQFEAKLTPLGYSIGLSTGDLDSQADTLALHDVLIVTSEKINSILIHSPALVEKIGLAVIDEVHLLDDEERGSTLEVVITKLLLGAVRLLLLSATIPNFDELTKWINGASVKSTYRPVKLRKGVAASALVLDDGVSRELGEKTKLAQVVSMALSENSGAGQAIIFVSTRRSAESVARELTPVVSKLLTVGQKQLCSDLSNKALKALSTPTVQCKNLSACVNGGIAFHHAGIEEKQRTIIEDGFKHSRCIKLIVATTTLAMGIDYPASWVIIRDYKRFSGDFMAPLPNLEIQQMLGRAGRPSYDKIGTGVIVCSDSSVREVQEKYFLGPLENIYSKLSNETALRFHCLALVASGYCNSFKSIYSFFGNTFFARQYGDAEKLFGKIDSIIMQLKEWDFVREKSDKLLATPVGKRVAQLYLDPLTGRQFVEFIEKHSKKPLGGKNTSAAFQLLFELSKALESRPLPTVNRKEEKDLWEELYSLMDDFADEPHALEQFKNAKIANAWANEETEEKILEGFNLPPGILHARMRNLEWLSYSLGELAYLLGATGVKQECRKLEKRVKYGVKEELLDLVSIRGIGRVRARKLFSSGIASSEQFNALSKDEVKKILGVAV